jgi:hypothetical protein
MAQPTKSGVRLKVFKFATKPVPPVKQHAHLIERYQKALDKYHQEQSEIVQLMCYFNRLWQKSFYAKKQDQIICIPLTRIQKTVRRGSRDLVEMVASIWFERRFRGNTITKKQSGWAVRKTPRINVRFAKFVKQITTDNAHVVNEMWRIAAEKNEVEVVVTTKVSFPTGEQAQLFAELLTEITNQPNQPNQVP